jgi:hypothetical protein
MRTVPATKHLVKGLKHLFLAAVGQICGTVLVAISTLLVEKGVITVVWPKVFTQEGAHEKIYNAFFVCNYR